MARFSKRHYLALSQTLKNAGVVLLATAQPEYIPAISHAFHVIQSRIIVMLCRDNPSFDPQEFQLDSDPEIPCLRDVEG